MSILIGTNYKIYNTFLAALQQQASGTEGKVCSSPTNRNAASNVKSNPLSPHQHESIEKGEEVESEDLGLLSLWGTVPVSVE